MAGKYKVQIKNNNGTMSDLPLVATYDSGGNNIAATYAKKTEGVYYIKGTGTTAGTWTGSHADITAYYDGLTIAYHTNIAGASTTTLNINGLGAKTCYLRGTTKVTTHYGVNTVIMFTYITVSGTGRWVTSDYDANSYAYLRQYFETANSELPLIMSHTVATSSDSDSYKTAYGGVVEGVTLNPSTKTISATAFKENGTTLADKYVAQVSGKGLSTNDYTTAEKTNLGKAVLTDNAQTITGVKTFNANAVIGNGKTLWFAKTGGTSQSGAANIKWDTAGNNAPYIGYATDQTDGTFVIASLKGTNYASGLAIGGGSGNLLWKGSKVITISDTATTSTAGAMSASDKSKLNGIATGANNYSLPAATSSTLGGVKTGSNITNSSGTISLTGTNVTNALGYTPASPTDLENKANVYTVNGLKFNGLASVNQTFPNNSDNKTIIGIIDNGNTGIISTNADSWNTRIYYSDNITALNLTTLLFEDGAVNNVGFSFAGSTIVWNESNLSNTYYDSATITALKNAFVEDTSGGIVVDCEYNHKEIQALKANSGGGGGAIYRHWISFGHSGPYAMDAIAAYSSSSEPVTTGASAFELLGSCWYATYMSSVNGEGMIIAKMTDSSTLSFKGAVTGTDTITYVSDTVTQV